MPGAVEPFRRLQKRPRPVVLPEMSPTTQPGNLGWCGGSRCRRECRDRTTQSFPRTHRALFNEILGELDLKTDREGNERTSYSLRHTYISMRLMEGADIYQVAKNCRTSVEMIEKYYASHIKDRLDASAINVQEAQEAGKAGPPASVIWRPGPVSL